MFLQGSVRGRETLAPHLSPSPAPSHPSISRGKRDLEHWAEQVGLLAALREKEAAAAQVAGAADLRVAVAAAALHKPPLVAEQPEEVVRARSVVRPVAPGEMEEFEHMVEGAGGDGGSAAAAAAAAAADAAVCPPVGEEEGDEVGGAAAPPQGLARCTTLAIQRELEQEAGEGEPQLTPDEEAARAAETEAVARGGMMGMLRRLTGSAGD